MSDSPADHGHTVAAWIAVSIAMLAFLVGCIGVVIASPMVFWIGCSSSTHIRKRVFSLTPLYSTEQK
jgi:hypothetical protein